MPGPVRGALLMTFSAIAVAACGSSDDGAAQSRTTPTTTKEAAVAVPEALSNFQCRATQNGWSAAGLLTNRDDNSATFRVTVYVGPADGAERSAVTEQFADIAAGGSKNFRIDGVPGEGDQCYVQVLSVK